MSGLLYSVIHTTPSNKQYEVTVWEAPYYIPWFSVSVYKLSRLLFFTSKTRLSYIEYLSRKEAFDNANAITTSQLISEK